MPMSLENVIQHKTSARKSAIRNLFFLIAVEFTPVSRLWKSSLIYYAQLELGADHFRIRNICHGLFRPGHRALRSRLGRFAILERCKRDNGSVPAVGHRVCDKPRTAG